MTAGAPIFWAPGLYLALAAIGVALVLALYGDPRPLFRRRRP